MVTVGTGEEVEVGWLRVERTSRAEEEELGGQGQLSTCWGLKNIYICVKCFADYVVFYFFSNRTSYWINWRVKSRDSIHFLLSFYVQHNDYIYVSNMHWLRIHQKILQNCVLTKSWKGDWVTYYVQHNDYIYIIYAPSPNSPNIYKTAYYPRILIIRTPVRFIGTVIRQSREKNPRILPYRAYFGNRLRIILSHNCFIKFRKSREVKYL